MGLKCMRDSNADVSVIIPVYNSETTIEACINSVLSQTLKSIQIIVVNDGSTDMSQKILNRITDDRLIIIEKDNGGVSDARDTGLECAIGKYIFFVDSDDYITLNCIEKMFRFADENNLDMVSCGHREENATLYGGNRNYSEAFIATTPQEIGLKFFELFPKSACAKLFRTSVVRDNNLKFPININNGEDACFTYEYLLHTKSVGKIAEVCYIIRNINLNSLSKRYNQNMGESIDILLKNWETLIDKYPKVEESYYQSKIDYKYYLAAQYANNLFMTDCPLTWKECITSLGFFLQNYRSWLVRIKDKRKMPKNLYEKLMYIVLLSKNRHLICLFFMLKEKIKLIKLKFYNIEKG